MADLNGSPQAGVGNPEDATSQLLPGQQNGGGQPGQDNQQYLTVEQAQQLFDSLFERKSESISAKTANRVKRVIAAAQQQGVNLTAAQAQNLIQEFDVLQADPSPQPQAGGKRSSQQELAPTQGAQPPQPEAGEQFHPVILTAMGMMEKAGVNIEDNDPELALIDQITTDEDVFLASIRAAIRAKKERLASNLPARMPTVAGGGGGVPAGGSKAALVAQMTELLKHPQANYAEIQELREQLKKFK